MAATVAEFRDRFPEFTNSKTYPDARVQMFLDDAAACVSATWFKQVYNNAVCYLAAHHLYSSSTTAQGGAGNVGPVSSKTAGGVSVSRAVNSIDLSSDDAYLSQTQYGLHYMYLRNKVKRPAFFTVKV